MYSLRKVFMKCGRGKLEIQKVLSQNDKEKLIDKFVYELPILRARVNMTQDEISEIVGLSRQTYSSLETRKRKMTWSNFMSILFVFYFNLATRDAVESAGIFPEELKRIMSTDHRVKTEDL